MKTLYISYFGAQKPLVQTQVVPYLRELSRAGVDVTLMTFEERTPGERARRAELRRTLAEAGIDWRPLRYHKRPSLPATMYDVAVGTLYGAWLVARRRIDVVHARNHVPATMALALSALFGTRLVFDLRGVMAAEYVDAGVWRPRSLPVRIVERVEEAAFRRADAIIMLTERIRGVLTASSPALRASRAHVEVIPCCVDVERHAAARAAGRGRLVRERLAIPADARVAVYAGSLGGWYLLDDMARQLAALRAALPSLRVLLLTPADHDLARAALDRAGLPPAAVTVAAVRPDEMPDWLAAADVGLSFIRPSFSKQSSSPTKIGEYLASGLPVLTNTGIGDVDALIAGERVGVLIERHGDAAEQAAAARAVAALLDEPDLVARCQRAARRHLDLATVGRAGYLRVYERLGLARPLAFPGAASAARRAEVAS